MVNYTQAYMASITEKICFLSGFLPKIAYYCRKFSHTSQESFVCGVLGHGAPLPFSEMQKVLNQLAQEIFIFGFCCQEEKYIYLFVCLFAIILVSITG
jgi:hypothetical protein